MPTLYSKWKSEIKLMNRGEEEKEFIEEELSKNGLSEIVALNSIPTWNDEGPKTLKSYPIPENTPVNYYPNYEINDKISFYLVNENYNLSLDAILNPTNSELNDDNEISNSIIDGAGPQLVKECEESKPCQAGQTIITQGFNLSSKFIIHAAIQNVKKKTTLQETYNSILDYIDGNKIKSIGLTSLSFPSTFIPRQAARIALECVRNWLEDVQNQNNTDRIIFLIHSKIECISFFQLVHEFFPLCKGERRKNEKNISEIKCSITNAPFKIVKNDNLNSIQVFKNWSDDISKRAKSGKKINISLYGNGYNLGRTQNSLSYIIIGEIFDDSFDAKKSKDLAPEVGVKGGYIIFTPMNNDMKNAISQILSDQNIYIFTFDFTAVFSTILEQGIKINFVGVFDSQVSTINVNSRYDSSFLCNTKNHGLKWFVEKSSQIDKYNVKSMNLFDPEKGNSQLILDFLNKDYKRQDETRISQKNLEDGVKYIYMIGLAAAYCISIDKADFVFAQTNKKIDEFIECAKKCGSVLAPSIQRGIAFFNAYSASNYNSLQLADKTNEDLLNLLNIFKNTFNLISGSRILKENYDCPISPKKAKEIYIDVICKLAEHKKELIEMLDKSK